MRRPIRNNNSDKPSPPCFCHVIIEDGDVTLEVKKDRNKYETISWDDMHSQVNLAMKKAEQEERSYSK